MSADPISDKELGSLLRLLSAALDNPDDTATERSELMETADHCANLLDQRRGLNNVPLTEREVKTLLKLLNKFRRVGGPDGLNPRECGVITVVEQWVKWYGHDALGILL